MTWVLILSGPFPSTLLVSGRQESFALLRIERVVRLNQPPKMAFFHHVFCLQQVVKVAERLFLINRLILQGFSQGFDGFL